MKANNKTVLVIEDDHETRVAIRNCLELAGYYVMSAIDGAKALELLGHISRPSAILLDLNMPIMNGEEFLRATKLHPDYKNIPVIQLSAETDIGLPGVHSAIGKPVDIKHLLKVLKSI